MIIPDPFKKKVKIPVRISNGQVNPFYGKELPKIRDAIGELVIPYYSLDDPKEADELSVEESSEMLPAGSILMINLKVDQYGGGVLTSARNPNVSLPAAPKEGFVRVILLEPLYLWHRGTKTSVLCPCKCELPDLEVEATSINHAYTIASKRFETKRTSNSGNVFRHVYHRRNVQWEKLEWLRERFDAKFEQKHYKIESTPLKTTTGPILRSTSPTGDQNEFEGAIEARPAGEAGRRAPHIGPEASAAALPPISERVRDAEMTPAGFDKLMAKGYYHFNFWMHRHNSNAGFRSIPLRILLLNYKLSKNQRRVMRINADLEIRIQQDKSLPMDEVELFHRHMARFGQNAPRNVYLPSNSPLFRKLRIFEGDRLIAASYFELGGTSSYGYYAIFDPEMEWRSLGIFTMLSEIGIAVAHGKEFYYLGYAYKEPTLYDYKKRFHGLEAYDWKNGEWKPFTRVH